MSDNKIPNARRHDDDTPVYLSKSFWASVVVVLGTIINGYMLYKTNENNQEFSEIQTVLTYLSEEVDKLRVKDTKNLKIILDQGKQIMQLTAQLHDKTTQADLLNGFMESIPYPAWIKQQGDDGIFRIVTINERFTVQYGLTKARAIGRSDYELFPLDLAEDYQAGDRKVLETGRIHKSATEMMRDNKRVPAHYVKFEINLPSGFQGIGGIITD